MATNLDLQEQEQLDELKAWWTRWGNLLLTAATIVLLAIAAYNGWRWYQRTQAAEATVRYEAVLEAVKSKDTKAVRDAAGELIEKYPRTVHAALAALVSAKAHFDANDLKTARSQLQWVVERTSDPELGSIARLRLANVLVDEKNYDDALKILGEKMGKTFLPLAASLRGDIHTLQGKKGDARAAYKDALERVEAKDNTLRERVQLKLDGLGEG
ncbi:MAG: tetratricopeptide repeat protein [Burkholderiales bacterium]